MATLTVLSCFDCICRDLLIAKLHDYAFELNALNVIQNDLLGRYKKIKVVSSVGDLLNKLSRLSEDSILGLPHLNINSCDLFLSCLSIALNLPTLHWYWFNWLQFNYFKVNESKCHLFLSPYKTVTIKMKECVRQSSNNEKRLGGTIDSKLPFDDHITNLCRITSQKRHAF